MSLTQLTSDQQQYIDHYKALAEISARNGWGDPHSYGRGKEIYADFQLGHKISLTLSGADAYNQNDEPVEYKSTIGKTAQGAYTGISVQSTWDEQKRYIIEDKIGKYSEHYYNRFDPASGLVESWKISGDQVLKLVLPKIRKAYAKTHTQKDPRIGVSITNTEIKKYGERVI